MKNSDPKYGGWFYRLCFALLVLPLVCSLVQYGTGIVEEKPLTGDYRKLSGKGVSIKSFITGSLQQDITTVAYQNIGFRPTVVRLHNQLEYSLFGDVPGLYVMGNDDQIISSIESELGKDFAGDSLIEQRVLRMRVLQDYLLRAKDTRLLTIIAPGKSRVLPEYLPDTTCLRPDIQNNYNSFRKYAAQYKLDVVDYNPLFRKLQPQMEYPLFPNTGYHWTDYGGMIGFDLLLQIMNERTATNLERVRVTSIEKSCEPRDTDTDDADRMNMLVTEFPFHCIGVPTIEYGHLTDSLKPKVLVISDSFWWKIYRQDLHQNHFAKGSQFWYYFDEAYSTEWEDARSVADADFLKVVAEADFVILMGHEGNLWRFPFGFDHELLKLYQQKGELGTSFELQL